MADNTVVQFRPKAMSPREMKKSVILQRIAEAHSKLLFEGLEFSPNSADGKGLAYGAYGLPIYYLADGAVHHVAGEHIDRMRNKRIHTRNAVELRCDALGLAIYLSGMLEVNEKFAPRQNGNPVGRGIRIVAYNYRQDKHSSRVCVLTPAQVLEKVHGILLNTYNHLQAEYNLIGLSESCLVLRSSHDFFPDIPLGLSDMESKA